jgi:hypothetical protein
LNLNQRHRPGHHGHRSPPGQQRSAHTIQRLPDNLDGAITILNRGGGPINNFDCRVGAATALHVTNMSMLGNCWIQGAPSVRSTTVQCAEDISVFDVSDELNINNTDDMHDIDTPAVTVRLNGVTPTGRGGKVTTTSGAIAATFPRAGGYDQRQEPGQAAQEGALSSGCTKQGRLMLRRSRQGTGLRAYRGRGTDYVGESCDSNVIIAYQ